ncbi:MAG: class I SAM-dependent rRNA methyltransferase [Chitinophagales bacterium]
MQVILQRGKGHRVEDGHPWIYKNEIDRIVGSPVVGDIVEVFNFKNDFIGKGYINEQSQITVRLLTRNKDESINIDFFKRKLIEARNYREKIGYKYNYRLVFGEADGLPALIIDKFNDIYVLQTLSAGMDRWKSTIAEILQDEFKAKGIYERNDAAVRKLEGVDEQQGFLSEPFDTNFIIDEFGVKFHVDIAGGQKTGFFLDQKENRLAMKGIAKNATVLDCFTYTGSFALFAAHFGAKQVIALDISENAIEQTKKNAILNNFTNIECITANAFDVLPVWVKEEKKFDVVILDPPAFTKNRKAIENAVKGYKEINLRGMKLVQSGGFLITFSCSHFMDVNLLYDVVASAAKDAGRMVREVQYLSQAKDHPIVWGIEETHYLKGLILQVL